MEKELTPTEIVKQGIIVLSNSYATVYQVEDRYFRRETSGWSEVSKAGSRFFFISHITGNEPQAKTNFFDLAVYTLYPRAEIIERFTSSGGIIKINDEFLRISYLHGVQKVKEGFQRWKTLESVHSAPELKRLIKEGASHGHV